MFPEFSREPEFKPLQNATLDAKMAYYRELASVSLYWQQECRSIIDRLVDDSECIEQTFKAILWASRMGSVGHRMARVVELTRLLRSGDFMAEINSRVARAIRRCTEKSMPERR